MDRLETRELAYFVAVAEELSFSRAATRLGISQPPLSRTIQQLERRLGVSLLRRTSRRVSLTPAGEVLLAEGRRVLTALRAATHRTQRAGQPEPELVLVMKPGGDAGLLPTILANFADDPHAVAVRLLVCAINEQERMLRDGTADVALLHLPWDDPTGFAYEELLVQSQVLVVPAGHRLSRRRTVRLADLAGEPLPRWPGFPDQDATGPEIRDSGQLLELIGLGRAVAVLPESVRDRLRPGLVAVPVLDAAPSTVALAWPEDSRGKALAAFVRVATETARTATTLSSAG
jgi:LysR family transcriptional regulator, benzoate and cis,cis-muconate-responsive activator of ben and cat genes